MKQISIFLLSIIIMTLMACSNAPLEVVKHVDINKYMGKWYEISSFPQSFQKGCSCSMAEYELMGNGKVKVTNSCNTPEKKKKSVGKAWVTDKTTNAKLRVRFFWPFSGKYWIIDLADDYSYAVVGHPNRKYLWILSRTPQMDKNTYANILKKVKQKGFDTSLLNKTVQDCW